MKILLDTHMLIWSMSEKGRTLPQHIQNMINDPGNEKYCSVVSIWETAIKYGAHPEEIGISENELAALCDRVGIIRLPLIHEHALTVNSLVKDENGPRHKDPFDKMLIAQAKYENMIFLTHDEKLQYYHEPCVIVI